MRFGNPIGAKNGRESAGQSSKCQRIAPHLRPRTIVHDQFARQSFGSWLRAERQALARAMHDASLDARGYELPYAAVGKIGFEGAHYRRDIAAKGLRG